MAKSSSIQLQIKTQKTEFLFFWNIITEKIFDFVINNKIFIRYWG